MNHQQKLECIHKLSEEELKKNILIPLFKNMGYKNVTDYHGTLEYGKDIIFYEEDRFGYRRYTGVQVKATDIHGTVGKSGNISGVLEQARQCLGIPFVDSTDGEVREIERCLIITSGKITEKILHSMKQELMNWGLRGLVRFIDGNNLVSLIDQHLKEYFWEEYDYFMKYFNAMKAEFERITDISALGRVEPVPLEQIYVSLKLIEKVPGREIPPEIEDKEELKLARERIPKEIEERSKRERILDAEDVKKEFKKIVIVGVPGSGKTTVLKHLALKSCMENFKKLERTTVPVPLTLRALLDSDRTLREYINNVFENFNFPQAKEYIEKDLKLGKCLLLLDGFDELATEDNQKRVTELIEEFMVKYRKNQTIVTSRIAGYHDELKGFTKLELMEFDDGQIEQFIKNWFSDANRADSIFNAIMENEKINAIARNPLLIAIIAIIYEEDKKLPQRRVDLYERCIDVLLSRWDVRRRIKNVYPPDVKNFILRKLALHFHTQQKRVLGEDEILEVMMKYFPDVDLKEEDAKPFLNEIRVRNYLLRQQSIESYDFLHLSFQEYFTALELEKNNDFKTLIENIDDPWWEEIILLFAGMKEDASQLITTIQDEIEEDLFHHNLLLFGKCVADADKTKRELRDQIVQDLWSIYKTSEIVSLRDKAINVLTLILQDKIIASLVTDLQSNEKDFRQKALHILGQIGSKKAVDSLINILSTDEDDTIRRMAVDALEMTRSEKAVEPLINALVTDEDRLVRQWAAIALMKIRSEKAVEPLINALVTDEDSMVRQWAAEALGMIGSEKAVEPLINAIVTDNEWFVRRWAAEALGTIRSEKTIEPLINAIIADKYSIDRFWESYVFGMMGSEKAVEPLIQALNTNEDFNILDNAASALGMIRSEKAVEPLINALITDENFRVRQNVVEALGEIRSEKALEPLINTLTSDEDENVRHSAANALGKIRSEKAVEPLINALTTDEDKTVRRMAAMALSRIESEKAIEPLINALTTDEDKNVRGIASFALGKIRDEKAIEPLINALITDEDKNVRRYALIALSRVGNEKAIEPLINALTTDEDKIVQQSVIVALGRIGDEKALEPLMSILKEEGVAFSGDIKNIAFVSLEKISRRMKIRIPLETS